MRRDIIVVFLTFILISKIYTEDTSQLDNISRPDDESQNDALKELQERNYKPVDDDTIVSGGRQFEPRAYIERKRKEITSTYSQPYRGLGYSYSKRQYGQSFKTKDSSSPSDSKVLSVEIPVKTIQLGENQRRAFSGETDDETYPIPIKTTKRKYIEEKYETNPDSPFDLIRESGSRSVHHRPIGTKRPDNDDVFDSKLTDYDQSLNDDNDENDDDDDDDSDNGEDDRNSDSSYSEKESVLRKKGVPASLQYKIPVRTEVHEYEIPIGTKEVMYKVPGQVRVGQYEIPIGTKEITYEVPIRTKQVMYQVPVGHEIISFGNPDAGNSNESYNKKEHTGRKGYKTNKNERWNI